MTSWYSTRDPSRIRVGRGVEWHPPNGGAWTTEVRERRRHRQPRRREHRRRPLDRKAEGAPHLDVSPTAACARRRDAREPIKAAHVHPGLGGRLRRATRATRLFDESAARGAGFSRSSSISGRRRRAKAEPVARLALLRFGVVLDKTGRRFSRTCFHRSAFGVGGPIGSGEQWMSWVDRGDAIRAVEWAIDNRDAARHL